METLSQGKQFVTSNLTAELDCPQCGKNRQVNVSDFMKMESIVRLKCKCTCGCQFHVELERRRSVRKPRSFAGYMIHHDKMVKIRINELSRHGMQFKLLEKINLEMDETVKVQFNADDPVKSPICRDVRVKKLITPKDIGCEFLSFDHQGNLGKYFLFYF